MLRRWTEPWTVRSLRDGDSEVSLVWRNRLPLYIVLVLILVELLFPSRVWRTLLIALATIMAFSAWWARQMAKGVRVRRDLRLAWVQAGDLLEERFTLANDSVLPALWVEVNDHGGIPGYNASTVRTVGPLATSHWVTRGECRLRGEYQMGPWEASTSDPLGIFGIVQRNRVAQTLLVYPPIAQRLPFALPRGATAGWAHVSQRSWEPTVTVGGVRAYVPGDPRHHIHWPTTARRDQLFAKEFDQETGGDIWLVLDLDRDAQVGSDERSTAEVGVILAGSVAAVLLDARRAVGLLACGLRSRTVLPARGRGHLWRLLRVLAQVRVTENRPLNRVLEETARALPIGATAVVITPSLDPEWVSGLARLRDRGNGVAVVLLDAASFAGPAATLPPLPGEDEPAGRPGQILSSVETLRGMLADIQVEAKIIHADTPLALRPPTGQLRRWEFKVLGTGRAVAVSTPWGEQG